MDSDSLLARFRKEWEARTPKVSYCSPDDPLIRQVLIRFIEQFTGQPRLQRIYDDYVRARLEDENFWESAIEWLRLNVKYDLQKLNDIPAEGPLIVVANHPFGVLDGIAVSYVTSQVRGDLKLLAHSALGRAEPLRPYLIPIEFDGASAAVRANVESKREALKHLKDGGTIVIFPAGRVSTAPRVIDRAIDAPWKLFAGKLIASSKATVVPVFFEGQNGFLFHLVSRFSEALREALLLREVAKRIGAEVTAHIGEPIPFENLGPLNDRQALLDNLRGTVYGLDPRQRQLAA